MIRAAIIVQRARWMRASPGWAGLALATLSPLVFLLPFHRAGIFEAWSQAAGILATLLPLVFAAALTRDSSRPTPSAVWLYQKGVPLEDWSLLRWLLDMALVIVLSALLMPGIVAGAWLWTQSIQITFAVVASAGGMCVAIAAGAFLFAVGAGGSSRGVDWLIVVALLAAVGPLFGRFLDPRIGMVLHTSLLPLGDAIGLPSHTLHGRWIEATHAALHLSLWCTAMIAIGVARLHRWRPGVAAYD